MPGVPWVFSFCMKDMLHDTDMFMLHDIGRATGHQPGKMTEYKPGGWPEVRADIVTSAASEDTS